MRPRQEQLERLRSRSNTPVLVVGGGVNGIGTFRDLALQGIEAVLVERSDFCSGASMASSHMLHGGLRYLEYGQFRLVREALHERDRLLRNAPHLAHPLPTVVPIYKVASGLLNAPLRFLGWRRRPSERGTLVVRIGLNLYDMLVGPGSPLPKHRIVGRQEALSHWPALNPNIHSVARYYDAGMVTPERLCIELLDDAEVDQPGALALNYVSVAGRDGQDVLLEDQLTGDRFSIRPRVVVNAAGPWIDQANGRLGPDSRFIGGTKGSHLIIDHPALRQALDDHEFFFENSDGRIVLIYPYMDRVLVGTTDIPVDDPDRATCTRAEVDYMLAMIGRVFPDIQVGEADVVFRVSGVRPLPPAQGESPAAISRDHHIELSPPTHDRPFPILSLVGGKWTTYRAFAEQAAQAVLDQLGEARRASTADLPIGGGRGFPISPDARADWVESRHHHTGIDAAWIWRLLDRYGTLCDPLLDLLQEMGSAPLESATGYARQEIGWLCRREGVVHLDDLLLRRTTLAWRGFTSSRVLDELSAIAGDALDWPEVERGAEVERTARILAERHGVHPD
jgi:glycerol-3-phosphate dehydrogenase